MAYWWVNHSQTHVNEIEGGYIWAPKEKSDGSKQQSYLNLTETTPGDYVFSYADGKIKAIGIVNSEFREQPKPSEYGIKGENWPEQGWAVPISWKYLSEPLIPKQHIKEIAPLLPNKYSPIQPNGNGNQGCYLASISDELGSLVLRLSRNENSESLNVLDLYKNEIEEIECESHIKSKNIEPTEKDQLIKARRGQGKFKENVTKIELGCRVTGVTALDILVASHIKPWKISNDMEKLDGNNGLLLSPHLDKLFDNGWITFLKNGDLICANERVENILFKWGIKLPVNVGIFNSLQIKYLNYHNSSIFRGNKI